MNFTSVFKNERFLLLFCVLGCAVNFIAYYPGFLSIDSIIQYGQVEMGRYNDWHPPMMAVFWTLLDKIHQGPSLMLLFQLSCLWGAAYQLLITFDNKIWRISIILLIFTPFIQNFAGYIVKDSEMALSWLLAFAIIFNAISKQRRMSLAEAVFSLIFLTYGAWIRSNSLPGILPLCLFWICGLGFTKNTINKLILTSGVLLLIFGGLWLANNKLIKPEKRYAENKLFLHDLTGIFVKTGKDVFPQMLYQNPLFDTADLRRRYDPATFDYIWWNKDSKVTIVQHQSDTLEQTLMQAWKKNILAYPGVYLRNRFDGFLYYLRIRKSGSKFVSYFMGIVVNDFGFSYHRNVLSDFFVFPVVFQKAMPYMRPWFWFILNFILLAFNPIIKRESSRLAFNALLWSGILYQTPIFFVFQTDTDFRYFYWNCMCCSLAICILLSDRYKNLGKPKLT